ncbi:MAG: hypothetical protein MSH18_04915 [Bacteroidales bacterium]|nr:hypothetical protein [Bacteroidales bacterium]
MKRTLIGLFVAILPLSANAINYDDARQQAYYLTDKMAYELDLSLEQYEYVYQINLDYFLSVNSWRDINGSYWNYRNMDLQYVLTDWQYRQFMAIDYFLRPIVWRQSSWFFPVVNFYHTGFYYFSRPNFYSSYQGRTWQGRINTAPSPYRGMVFNRDYGMRERYRGSNHSSYPQAWGRDNDRRGYNNGRYNQNSQGYNVGRGRTNTNSTAGRYYDSNGNTSQPQQRAPQQNTAHPSPMTGRTYGRSTTGTTYQQQAPSVNRSQSAPAQQSTSRSAGRTFGR